MNIKSTQIRVFPTVHRNMKVSGDIYSRHTSEDFLTSIVNRLIDEDGFVITVKDDFHNTSPFRFNIHGYYFNVETLDDIIDSFDHPVDEEGNPLPAIEGGSVLYAYIKTKDMGGNWKELLGNDESSVVNEPPIESYTYTGLVITDTPPIESDDLYFLPILIKSVEGADPEYNWNKTGWYVPSESYIKFNGPSFKLDRIDGGDMDINK